MWGFGLDQLGLSHLANTSTVPYRKRNISHFYRFLYLSLSPTDYAISHFLTTCDRFIALDSLEILTPLPMVDIGRNWGLGSLNYRAIKIAEHKWLTFEGLVVAFGEEKHGLGGSLRCLEEPLAVGVLPKRRQQQAVGARHVRQERLSGGGAVVQLQVVVERALLVTCENMRG